MNQATAKGAREKRVGLRVMAIDPGHNTGWATGLIKDKQLQVLDYGYTPWWSYCLRLHRAQADPDKRYDLFVYESWLLTPHGAKVLVGSDMQSSQCIGVIKYIAHLTGARMHMQHPKHKHVIDDIMGGAEAYLPQSTVEHDRDALRHLWYYAIKNEGVTP